MRYVSTLAMVFPISSSSWILMQFNQALLMCNNHRVDVFQPAVRQYAALRCG